MYRYEFPRSGAAFKAVVCSLAAAACLESGVARAQDGTLPSSTPAAAPVDAPPAGEPAPAPPPGAAPEAMAPVESPAPPPPPAPYSLPFQLRPATAASVVRLDTSLGIYEDPITHNGGSAVASMLLASYKVAEGFAPLVRIGVVSNSPPTAPTASSGFDFLNPILGATYALKPLPALRLAFFLGVTVPIGTGGGSAPDAGQKAALAAGIATRSAMDNAMFAVNDFTVIPGFDIAYVAGGLTVQAEATLLQLTRVSSKASEPDGARTNFTAGLHVGYFIVPEVSLGVELRHQRWLSTPTAVEKDTTNTTRDTSTFAVGPRFHIPLGGGKFLRPAVTFATPLDNPLHKSSYKIFQLDIPFYF